MSIKHIRKYNNIISIHNVDGDWIQFEEEVQQAFTQFYSSCFGKKMEDRTSVRAIIIDQGPRLTDDNKNTLLCFFQEKEIKQGLDAIPINKYLGLDDFNIMV